MSRTLKNGLRQVVIRTALLVGLCAASGCSSLRNGPFQAWKVDDPPHLSPYQQPLTGGPSGRSGGARLMPGLEPVPSGVDPDASPGSMPDADGESLSQGPLFEDESTVRQRLGVPPGIDPLLAPELGADSPTGTSEERAAAPFTLDVVAPRDVVVGEPIDFVIHISHRHTQPLEKVQIECELDEGLEFPGMSERAFRQKLGQFTPGQKQEITLSLICQEAGEHCVHFVLRADGASDVERSHCVRAAARSIEFDIAGPTQRAVGSRAEYVLTLANYTGRDVPGVRVELSHDSILTAREASVGVVQEPGRLIWDLGVLRVQERVEIQVEFACPLPTHETCLVAELSSFELPTESRRMFLEVQDEGLLNVAVQDEQDVIQTGEITIYTIHVLNRGLEPAHNVRLLTSLSEHLEPMQVTIAEGWGEVPRPRHVLVSDGGPLQFPVIPPDGVITVRVIARARHDGVAHIAAQVVDSAGQRVSEESTVIIPRGR